MNKKMISIIVATYNEEKIIKKTLEALPYDQDVEIIVVDGQSTDQTQNIIGKFPVKMLSTDKNRAKQFNLGAKTSRGDILVFLHADCSLETGALDAIKKAIAKGFIGGGLSQEIRDSRKIYERIAKSGNLRAKILKIFFGDQALFVRRNIFFDIGGFDEVELFDDVLFSKKLRKKGKTVLLDKKVFTYSRRWTKQGVIKTTAINWLITAGFVLGVSPRFLRRVYKDIR